MRQTRRLSLFLLIAVLAVACRATPSRVAETAATAAPATTGPTPTRVAAATTVPPPATVPSSVPPVVSTTVATVPPVPATRAVNIGELLALSSLQPVDCPADVSADQVSCSIAVLPLNIYVPVAGENVELMVAFVDNGDPNGVGPVAFLQGGPGVGSVTAARNFVGATHDVLFVDQRGTGYSTPKLNCPEVDDLWLAHYTDDPAVRISDDESMVTASYQACATRLMAGGINFDHFNTTAAAADVELLRQLFGYDEWSIWGISYGTRLGLTIMRDHPNGVRSAVLDSIVPFEVDFFAAIPGNGIRSMTALDQACDDDRCAADHGDFLDNLSALVLELSQNPVVVSATRPGSGDRFPFRVDGETLIDLVFTQLYSTGSLRALPRQIARADAGGLSEIVATFMTRRDPNAFDLSIGLYYTTWCREELPFYDDSGDDELLRSLEPRFGDAVAGALSSDGVQQLCDFFMVAPSAPLDDEPLESPIPTLVFAGAFDPITPPAWSKQVADALTNSTYVELADHGHGMATSCPANIRLAFLIDPSALVDTTCADDTGAPDFG